MRRRWYSAMLRWVVTVGGEPSSVTGAVVVLRARGWDAAQRRAEELGRAGEATYRNADGAEVCRRFAGVETLDLLGRRIADGREVYAEGKLDATPEDLAALPAPGEPPTQTGV